MPMVALTYRAAPEDCNWTVEDVNPVCDKCRPLIAAIVKEAARQFDVRDPVSTPYFPLPPAGASNDWRARY